MSRAVRSVKRRLASDDRVGEAGCRDCQWRAKLRGAQAAQVYESARVHADCERHRVVARFTRVVEYAEQATADSRRGAAQ